MSKRINPFDIIKYIARYFLKITLLPFSLIYWLIISFRNQLYSWGVLSSISFDIPIISVGNLSVGGTGKTPFVSYLTHLLNQYAYQVAILSRGYKRKSTGFRLVGDFVSAREVGDEPKQLKNKYPHTTIAVCADRVMGISEILALAPHTQMVLLDDAFQHRALNVDMRILLTTYDQPFYRDIILPSGRLREPKKAYKRAHIIIVSKCPPSLSIQERQAIIASINPLSSQRIYFTYIKYNAPYKIGLYSQTIALDKKLEVVLFCGLANPKPLIEYIRHHCTLKHHIIYRDHYDYQLIDLVHIRDIYALYDTGTILLTTEKDAAKIQSFNYWLSENALHLYVIPIEAAFLSPSMEKDFITHLTSYMAPF